MAWLGLSHPWEISNPLLLSQPLSSWKNICETGWDCKYIVWYSSLVSQFRRKKLPKVSCACTPCYCGRPCSSRDSWRASCVGRTRIPRPSSWQHLPLHRPSAYKLPISCWDRNAEPAVHSFASPCSPSSQARCRPMWSRSRPREGRGEASFGWECFNYDKFHTCLGAFIHDSKRPSAPAQQCQPMGALSSTVDGVSPTVSPVPASWKTRHGRPAPRGRKNTSRKTGCLLETAFLSSTVRGSLIGQSGKVKHLYALGT